MLFDNGVIPLKIVHKITKDREKTYYTIPFEVEAGIEKVTVSYSYHRATKGLLGDLHPTNTVDIGLMDADGKFLGWSGSARDTIYVGEYSSTKGYLSQPIQPGEWKIIVGAYHIVDEGAEVTYNIEFKKKQPELLFGDLHIHSDASDGKYDAHTLAKLAKKKKLDFIALANHNNCSENLCLPRENNLTFIPAVEWTHYNGHMNFFGVSEPFENSFIANDESQAAELIQNARKKGALISVNHPKCSLCPYLWKNEDFDTVEIWNGPMTARNLRAIEYWTSLLRQGRKLPAIGGSDYHRPLNPARIANPVTAVLSESRSSEDILKAIAQGHCFVTSSVNGIRPIIRCGDAFMGDTVASGNKHISIEIENLKGEKLILITNNGETVIQNHCFGTLKKEIPLPQNINFAYIKLTHRIGKKEYVGAITNPIYFE